MIRIYVILSLFLSSYMTLMAQDGSIDPDAEFAKAREFAFNDKRSLSIKILKNIVVKYPNYDEVRLFLGTVYGWEEEYKLARKELQILIEKNEQEKDYWVAAIKNEVWAEQAMAAIDLSKKGLVLFPNDIDITLLKAKAEKNNYKLNDAFITIKAFLKIEPDNVLANEFLQGLKEDFATNNISIGISIDRFTEIYDPMTYYYLGYGKETKWGSITGRVNVNKKFGELGTQFEIDAYPSLGEGLYAYMNFGVSNSSIFPGLKYGAQLYKSLPKSFEASIGIRRLKFTEYTTIYTGSLGKYFGNSFINFVPYLIPSNEGLSKSGTLNYRKYGANGDQYFSVTAGVGFSPEINRFGLDTANEPIISLKSQKLGVSKNFKVKNNNNILGIGVAIAHQESLFDPGEYIWIISASLSYSLSY